MIFGFAHLPDGSVDQLDSLAAVKKAQAKGAKLWIDLQSPDEALLREIGDLFKLNADALDDCLHGEQRPRIDDFDEYFFIVLYGVGSQTGNGEYVPRKLAAFFGAGYLITVHTETLPSVEAVKQRCERLGVQILGKGMDFILYGIVDGVVDKYVTAALEYEKLLDVLEDESQGPDVDEEVLNRLSDLRRDILDLRIVAASKRELLVPLANGEYDYISEALERRFSHVRDHLTQVVEMLDAQREHLNAIRDNFHMAVAQRTSEAMNTLTIFATIMLPLTLIAGIYGMNLPLWPPPDEPTSFWIILGAMAVITTGMLYYFRRRRWL